MARKISIDSNVNIKSHKIKVVSKKTLWLWSSGLIGTYLASAEQIVHKALMVSLTTQTLIVHKYVQRWNVAKYILMASLPLHFKMIFATHYRSGPARGSQKMQRRRLSVSYCPLILP